MLGPITIVPVRSGIATHKWLLDMVGVIRSVFPHSNQEARIEPCHQPAGLAEVIRQIHVDGRALDLVIVSAAIMESDEEAYELADAIKNSGVTDQSVRLVVLGDGMSEDDFQCYWRMVHDTWTPPTMLLTSDLKQTLSELRKTLLGRVQAP